jgi:hypothetical protein
MVMATLGKAKILGLIIDRREVGEAGAFDNMTDEQLIEEAKVAKPRLKLVAAATVKQTVQPSVAGRRATGAAGNVRTRVKRTSRGLVGMSANGT